MALINLETWISDRIEWLTPRHAASLRRAVNADIKEARPTVRRVRPCNKRKVVITCDETIRSPCKDRDKNRVCKFPVGDCSAQVKTTIA